MNARIEHYATVEELNGRFVASWKGREIARARSVFCLRERHHDRDLPAVYYFRPADVDASVMEPSPRQTYCPIKGHATYRHLIGTGHRTDDAVWTYLHPLPMAGNIRGCYAFDSGKGVQIQADIDGAD